MPQLPGRSPPSAASPPSAVPRALPNERAACWRSSAKLASLTCCAVSCLQSCQSKSSSQNASLTSSMRRPGWEQARFSGCGSRGRGAATTCIALALAAHASSRTRGLEESNRSLHCLQPCSTAAAAAAVNPSSCRPAHPASGRGGPEPSSPPATRCRCAAGAPPGTGAATDSLGWGAGRRPRRPDPAATAPPCGLWRCVDESGSAVRLLDFWRIHGSLK